MTQRAQATKRKRQAANEAPPAKRGNAASSLPAKKPAAKPAQRGLKGKAQKVFPRKKPLAGASERSQEQKPSVKTSSLFKNNPEIPELPRYGQGAHGSNEGLVDSASFSCVGTHARFCSSFADLRSSRCKKRCFLQMLLMSWTSTHIW